MRRFLVLCAASAFVWVGSDRSDGAPFAVFSPSTSYATPETISQAPSTFGSFGGDYFIPDFNRAAVGGHIWMVPSTGGPPISFATNTDYAAEGGVFLPATGWGTNSGKFLAGGSGSGLGVMFTYAPDGTRSTFVSNVATFQPSQPVLAPAGFGNFGGQLIVANTGGNQVLAFTPSATASAVATPFGNASPFGLAFAPAGFGALGGDLFVSNGTGNTIDVVRGDGTFSPFATIPLLPGQIALRQLGFSPSGFLPGFGPLLFASVSGSTNGGGTLGDVVALDSNGTIVASLRKNLGLTKFDPRGMFFTSDGNVLINDASDAAVYIAQGSDFAGVAAIPEPATCVLLGTGLAGVVALGLRRQRTSQVA
jgi:hypothetical protein